MNPTQGQQTTKARPVRAILPQQLRCKRCNKRLADIDTRGMAGRVILEAQCPKTECSNLNRFELS